MQRSWMVLLCAGLFLTGCHSGRAWSSSDQQAFLEKCQKQQPAESCRCVLNALKGTLSATEYRALSDPKSTQVPPPEQMAKVREAVMGCQTEKK